MSRSKLVSIVDDEPEITELFCDALCRIEGCRVFKFTDPALALEHFKINVKDYALVVSDLRMPIINGMQLLKTVKDLNPFARTILMTAFATDDEVFQEYIKRKIINALLQKPIRVHNFINEVQTELDFYQTQEVLIPKARLD
ncbi:MAG TPA: response regulator [Nitrososphaeraceae archaeon]|jgi:DNA-binding NtrC family response regulator